MRGRRPRPLSVSAADAPILAAVARSRRLAWFRVQHARIVLAVAAGERIGDLATRLECDRTTVWRVCRRYGHAERLARRGIWVVCTDEIPNLQVLERNPIRRAVPGHIEQQEFEYTRHGTVNLLLFLVVHTGQMELAVLGANDAAHYIPALRGFRGRHRGLKGVFLIHDGGASCKEPPPDCSPSAPR